MNYYINSSILLITTLMGSCASNTGTGVITGGVLGAGVGGIAAGGKGALIGGAAGALVGGVIGASLDAQDRKVVQKTSPRTLERMDRRESLTINDVIKLAQASVSDDTIINYMQEQKTIYTLSQAQVRRMQDAGVSARVIDYMNATAS